MVRPFRERRDGSLLPRSARSVQDESPSVQSKLASGPRDARPVGALPGGPGQKELGGSAAVELDRDLGGVLGAGALPPVRQPRRDGSRRSAQPVEQDVEGVPSVIEKDAAALLGSAGPPVRRVP